MSEASKVCKEMLASGYSIRFGRSQYNSGGGSSIEDYQRCMKAYRFIKLMQPKAFQRTTPKVFTANQIRDITAFVRRNNIDVMFEMVFRHMGATVLALPFRIHGEKIIVNVASPAPDDVQISLEHEYGHVRDDRMLASIEPRLKPYLRTGLTTDASVSMYTRIVFRLIEQSLTPVEAARFKVLQSKVIGNLSKIPHHQKNILVRYLKELVRLGEEILDGTCREHYTSDTFLAALRNRSDPRSTPIINNVHNVQNSYGKSIEFNKLIVIAMYKEMDTLPGSAISYWQAFKRKADFFTKGTLHLDDDQIEFCRLIIRGSRNARVFAFLEACVNLFVKMMKGASEMFGFQL